MFALLKDATKFVKAESVTIDSWVFRLHYRHTCVLLLGFTALLGAKQYYGDPIHCLVERMPEDMVNSYCWTHGTWTTPELAVDGLDAHVAFPGVGAHSAKKNHTKIHHSHYQWVPLAMALSAICFYLPRGVWKSLEAGRMNSVCADMAHPCLNDDYRQREDDRARVLARFMLLEGSDSKATYALRFVLRETLNLLNVVAQWFITDALLNGAFMAYGHKLVQYVTGIQTADDDALAADPAEVYFPKVTHCSIGKHGPSGNIQRLEGICVLPLNVLNEKIYLALWVWYLVLLLASAVFFLFRLVTILMPFLRAYLIQSRCRSANWKDVSRVCKKMSFGSWFVLSQLAKNVDSRTFCRLMEALARPESMAQLMGDEETESMIPEKQQRNGIGMVKKA